jgi:N6-L-threonylcarbamoyladenine synthase
MDQPVSSAHKLPIVLGVESSCDETGVALVTLDPDTGAPRLLGQALHTQVAMHAAYGGVVPELASRDHIRRVVPLLRQALAEASISLAEVDAIAYTAGPGLAGALLVGSAFAEALAFALEKPVLPVHHLEGHLLSPLLASTPPEFPFVALLVSGGHTQLMRVTKVGEYELLGETLDDAAGEAFDKTAKLLGLGYPGGPALSKLAETAEPDLIAEIKLPRPMLHSGDLEFSFAGLKTAVLTKVKAAQAEGFLNEAMRAALAAAVEQAIIDVLVAKSVQALKQTGLSRLVVAGGVGANRHLRETLVTACKRRKAEVYFPELDLCTDNGAMIALAGLLRLVGGATPKTAGGFSVKPRWPLIDA